MAFENEIRNAEIIERWGIVRMHRRGSVGAHSHRVAIYADQIATIMGLSLHDRYWVVLHALWHDMPEVFSGDICGPVKDGAIDREKLKRFEDVGMLDRFPGREWQEGSDHHRRIVKVADLLDELLWCVIEKRMGNSLLDEVYEGTNKALFRAVANLRCGDEACQKIYGEIVSAIGRHTFMPMHTLTR